MTTPNLKALDYLQIPGKAWEKAHFETDTLQETFIYNSMRENKKFLRTMHTDFTPQFTDYLIRKTELDEPIGIGIKGVVRGGKSSFAILIACFLCGLRNKKMDVDHICKNEFDFLEKVPSAEFGDVYVIDESKCAVYGIGSVAKRMKLKDIQNIIAVKNISTFYLTPREFNDTNSDYGFHVLGRARNCQPRLIRSLLYNLQERAVGTYVPYGLVTYPLFMDTVPYGEQFNKEYMQKKLSWVNQEQKSEGTIMHDIQLRMAKYLMQQQDFMAVKKKRERMILAKKYLADEFTEQEKGDIVSMVYMLEAGTLKFEDKKA